MREDLSRIQSMAGYRSRVQGSTRPVPETYVIREVLSSKNINRCSSCPALPWQTSDLGLSFWFEIQGGG